MVAFVDFSLALSCSLMLFSLMRLVATCCSFNYFSDLYRFVGCYTKEEFLRCRKAALVMVAFMIVEHLRMKQMEYDKYIITTLRVRFTVGFGWLVGLRNDQLPSAERGFQVRNPRMFARVAGAHSQTGAVRFHFPGLSGVSGSLHARNAVPRRIPSVFAKGVCLGVLPLLSVVSLLMLDSF